MKSKRLRWVISLLVGLSVFVLTGLAGWRQSPHTLMNNDTLDTWSLASLRELNEQIQIRLQNGENLPDSLLEMTPPLKETTFPNSSVKIVKNGRPIDGWGRPLLYSAHETSYTLLSYGRDGKPGGIGLDRDLDPGSGGYYPFDESDWKNPPRPTLRQFIFELPPGRGMILGCVINGVLASLVCLFLVRPVELTIGNGIKIGLQIVIIVIVALLFGTGIMNLHIPTGH